MDGGIQRCDRCGGSLLGLHGRHSTNFTDWRGCYVWIPHTFTGDFTGDLAADVSWTVGTTSSFTLNLNPAGNFVRNFGNPAFIINTTARYIAVAANQYYMYTTGSTGTALYAYVGLSPSNRDAAFYNSGPNASARFLIPFTFSDNRINGGQVTNAFADIHAFNTSATNHTVDVVRCVFDDANTAAPGDAVAGETITEWAPVVAAPEIDMQGNGNSITDGDTTPSTVDLTDFGNSQVGTPVARTFQIRNTGTADLTVTSASAPAGDFAVGATSETVTAGNSLDLDVTFTPSSSGTKTATITVSSDDSDESTYTFDVSGVGTATPVAGNPNAALQTSLGIKIKKLKKQLKKAKSSGNVAKAKKIKKKIKKFAKKLKAL